MYDLIPNKFVASGQIFDYFALNNIAIVHLVREAKILRHASHRTSGGLPAGKPHTRNATEVIWNKDIIKQIQVDEKEDSQWEISLQFKPKMKYYRLIYERMLLKEDLLTELGKLFEFLNINNDKSLPVLEADLLLLHGKTCKERIGNYEMFRKEVAGTRTLAACDMLDGLFGDNA